MRELRLQHPNKTMWKGAHNRKILQLCFFHFERFRRGRFWSFCETPTVRTWHLLKACHGISRRFYIKSVRHGCRAGPGFIPWQHAAVRENVQRAWARDSKGGSPRARVSSDLISEMDPGGCREGRGVAFTTTFSFASCKMTGQEEGGRGDVCTQWQSKMSAWKPSMGRWKSTGEVMVQKRNGQKYAAPSLNNEWEEHSITKTGRAGESKGRIMLQRMDDMLAHAQHSSWGLDIIKRCKGYCKGLKDYLRTHHFSATRKKEQSGCPVWKLQVWTKLLRRPASTQTKLLM